jgi:peptide/nickel transport system permease protein
MPFALAIGIIGAVVTTFAALILSAAGTWRGGWLDNLIQRLTEVNMILPVLAIGILVFALYNVNLYYVLGAIILLSIFGSPTKTFRSAFLQVKEEPFLESARAYGASNSRIVFRYMIPRIFPLVIPQLIILIPSFVFLEATLAIFNVFDPRYPTWGKIIYEAISRGAWWGGSHYWVLEPISLLLLAGLGFALLGSVLERILTPRLQDR